MRWGSSVALMHILAFVACATASSGNPASPTDASLDQPFKLSPGASVVIKAETLEVGFDRVLSDSRCPRGVNCIVAGEATVRVWLSKSATTREDRELKTPGAEEAVYGAYRIKLVSLDPYPTADRTIRPSDYVVTLVVSRDR